MLLLLGTLSIAGCSDRVCPLYVLNDGDLSSHIGVDATAYVIAHPAARRLCAGGRPCVTMNPATPAQIFLPAPKPGTYPITVTITTADGAILLFATHDVTVRHIKSDDGCGHRMDADQGFLEITAAGTLL